QRRLASAPQPAALGRGRGRDPDQPARLHRARTGLRRSRQRLAISIPHRAPPAFHVACSTLPPRSPAWVASPCCEFQFASCFSALVRVRPRLLTTASPCWAFSRKP